MIDHIASKNVGRALPTVLHSSTHAYLTPNYKLDQPTRSGDVVDITPRWGRSDEMLYLLDRFVHLPVLGCSSNLRQQLPHGERRTGCRSLSRRELTKLGLQILAISSLGPSPGGVDMGQNHSRVFGTSDRALGKSRQIVGARSPRDQDSHRQAQEGAGGVRLVRETRELYGRIRTDLSPYSVRKVFSTRDGGYTNRVHVRNMHVDECW